MSLKVIGAVKNKIWNLNHRRLTKHWQSELTNPNVSIISMNCNGGILYHDLGLQFKSPTVNLFMRAGDFIKFCENLEYYLNIDEFVECKDKDIIEERTYPIAFLGDLTLFLVHYTSIEEAMKKWNERKKRVNWDNIVILNTDREGTTEEIKDRFERLPYRKVMFTHLPDEKHKSCYYIKGYESETSVGLITDPIGISGKRPIDQFDWVSFINGD